MTMRMMRVSRLAGVGLVMALAGCGGNMGALGDILAGAAGAGGGGQQQGSQLYEVQAVDQRNQAIQVRTSQGQTGAVRYDQNTQVVYQQQQYPVTALERGDVIEMQIQQTQQGEAYVSQILVRQSVQERTGQQQGGQQQGGVNGGQGQVQAFQGTVGQIDYNNRAFQLQTQQGTATVFLSLGLPNQTLDRFERLRTGEQVRIQARHMGNGRVELLQFN